MRFRSNLTVEQNLASISLRAQVSLVKKMGENSTWLLTGAAAVIGALLVNSQAVSAAVLPAYLRFGLICLTFSLVAGGVVKQAADAISTAFEGIDTIVSTVEANAAEIGNHPLDVAKLKAEILDGYAWPMKWFIRRSLLQHTTDPISGEKRLIRLMSIQLVAFWIQMGLTASGLVGFACGIK